MSTKENTTIFRRVCSAILAILSCALLVGCLLGGYASAWADETDSTQDSAGTSDATDSADTSDATDSADTFDDLSGDVIVSADGDAALIDGASFAISNFSRAQKGSNRDQDGVYVGYTYYEGSTDDYAVAVVTDNFVLVYVPESVDEICDITDTAVQNALTRYFVTLDEAANNAGVIMSADVPWYFTNEKSYEVEDVVYQFSLEIRQGSYYVSVIGADGSDVVTNTEGVSTIALRPSHVDFAHIVPPDEADIVLPATGFAAIAEFFASIDYSPLWVTLRTTLTAIVFIFVLGLAAAYFTLRIPKRAQSIFDAIFTIPMVLPPTVCGFLLLLALGSNSPVGQWFDSIGFRLVFSWPATVIAATVVAFPLMYRNSRGAFENLDPNMMDAARTLGWSNPKIFIRLMIPLSWGSIAAATVLAFARALGEFGATLFLAGNYVGITRTIPIAIYFEWMSGNTDVAIFWSVVVIIFSFIVILFVNLWTRRTTKYRRQIQ